MPSRATKGKLLVGSIGGNEIAVTADMVGAFAAKHVFVADKAYQVTSIREIHSVVGSTSAACRPRKVTDTSAPGAAASGTVKELTQANFDLTATINTTQVGTLSATLSDLQLAVGDKIALNNSGTLTGLIGVVLITLKAL